MKTDLELQHDVLAELNWEPSVNAAQIGVAVNDGVVTLSGQVGSFAEKWSAELAVQRVAGVKALTIEMDVKLPGHHQHSDAEIARSADSALKWTSGLPNQGVQVMVEKGWITLSGSVRWNYQRQAALAAVRDIQGVAGLHDQITLAPDASPGVGVVKADIEAAFRRRAQTTAPRVVVSVQGGDVTLTGTVHSWAERNLARHSAWCAPGVRNVIDNIEVELGADGHPAAAAGAFV
jgi:osmotically-inducible protein OsmY